MKNNIPQQLEKVLQDTFKFNAFRPGQLEALMILMEQGRMLCIQPTGYGKSLLYQLPAVLLDGLTLVISPLLALMRDQVMQLKTRFNIAAASINTDQSEEENHIAKQAAIRGSIRILFVAPEQLDHIDKFNFLLGLPIRLLVVDEAHCISTWGHDFRPSYRQIIKLVHALTEKNSDIKLLGLTATANSKTEADIKQQLSVVNKKIIVHRENMDRPNIRLSVVPVSGIPVKLATLAQLLAELEGSGIVYCATRENTELVAEYLRGQNVNAMAYHAGVDVQQKRCLQQDFISDKYSVIAATNALGMGIDKSNLRFVIHFDYPGSVTAYYQEVGRSGRDGLPADGILLYDAADNKVQKYFIESAQPTFLDFKTILDIVAKESISPNLATLKRLTGMHPTKLFVVVAELIEQGFLKKISKHSMQMYVLGNKSGLPSLQRYTEQFSVRSAELKTMQRYAEQKQKCLMKILREVLGDEDAKACQQCSVCSGSAFKVMDDKNYILTISSWLQRRTVSISLSKVVSSTLPGIAVLDGKLRSDDFISFMHARSTSHVIDMGISDSLMDMIKVCLTDLIKHYKLGCIIPVPSGTWGARDPIVSLIANYLKIPVFYDLLAWQLPHSIRQGELLNNDQRKHNVSQQMHTISDKIIPKGVVLLFDDYIGSGATLNEAARSLRECGHIQNEILPFTIAAVKWRLGKRGMI